MQAGKMDRRPRFEQATSSTASASGEPTLTWSELATVWGSKEPLSGREATQAQQLVARIDTRFRVRYSATLAVVTPTATFRLVCDGRTYDITAVTEIGRREGLEILAFARAE